MGNPRIIYKCLVTLKVQFLESHCKLSAISPVSFFHTHRSNYSLSADHKMAERYPKIVYNSLDSILEVLNRPEHKTLMPVNTLLSVYDKVCAEEKRKQHIAVGKKYPLIVLEGLDACGKSTATSKLAKTLNAEICMTPPTCLHELRPLFDGNMELRATYYALGNYIAAAQMLTILESQPVVLDRYWHSTTVYALAQAIVDAPNKYCLPEPGDDIYKWPLDLLRPDVVIFMNVSEDVRLNRIKGRQTLTKQEKLLKSQTVFRESILSAYKRMTNPSVEFVNADLPKSKVQLEILKKVENILPKN